MGQINQIPAGFLSLLNAKGNASIPSFFVDQLVPQLDLTQFYLATTKEQIVGVNQAAAVGTLIYTDLQVPTGQIWWVHDMAIACITGVGAAAEFAAAWQMNVGFAALPLGPYVSIAASQDGKAMALNRFFLTPGSRPCALIKSQTLAPNISCNLVISRLLF